MKTRNHFLTESTMIWQAGFSGRCAATSLCKVLGACQRYPVLDIFNDRLIDVYFSTEPFLLYCLHSIHYTISLTPLFGSTLIPQARSLTKSIH